MFPRDSIPGKMERTSGSLLRTIRFHCFLLVSTSSSAVLRLYYIILSSETAVQEAPEFGQVLEIEEEEPSSENI